MALKTYITKDGLLVRRSGQVQPKDQAERIASNLNNLNTVLQSWVERVGLPHQDAYAVVWLPSSDMAQSAMKEWFAQTEIDKAEKEGKGYRWSPTMIPNAYNCHNPKTKQTYRVTKKGGKYTCNCWRHRAAGVCKHSLSAVLHEVF